MSFVAPLKDSESTGGLVFFVFEKNSSALDLLGLRKIRMLVKKDIVSGPDTIFQLWQSL